MGSMDGDESVDALNASIDGSMAELARLNNELVGLESYRSKIMAEGMSKNIGIGLEHVAPGTLGNLNLNMLTEAPTTTKMNVALESIDWKSKITKIAIVILVVGVILKMLDWLLTPSGNRVSGDSRDGEKAAKAVHEAKEKLRDELKKAGDDIRERPTQNVIAELAERDEKWMAPVYRVLIEQVDKRKITEREALTSIETMKVYRALDINGGGDMEVNLALTFIFILKSGIPLELSSFAYYMKFEPNNEISSKIPGPFASSLYSYANLRTKLGYAVLTITRILEQGTASGKVVEDLYKTSGDKSKFNEYVNEIAKDVTMYNDELKNAFDHVYGDGADDRPFEFIDDEKGNRWVSGRLGVNRYNVLAKDRKSYYGQPPGSKYNHLRFTVAGVNRNTETYRVIGSRGEDLWWGDGYRELSSIGRIDVRGRETIAKGTSFDELSIEAANWMVKMLNDENDIRVCIFESNSRMLALRDEFMGSGNTETTRLKDLCEKLLADLKVIEKRSKENVPTVWHVPWKSTVGLHFSDIDLINGRERGLVDSVFGEVCTHLLNGVRAQLNAYISTKGVYQKVEKSYIAFRESVEKFRL